MFALPRATGVTIPLDTVTMLLLLDFHSASLVTFCSTSLPSIAVSLMSRVSFKSKIKLDTLAVNSFAISTLTEIVTVLLST
ncbi:hypothetical protein D3C86_1962180 [compost metagenome]